MAVDPKDREAYEDGVADSKKGELESWLDLPRDFVGKLTRSESEEAAYNKGLAGEQLDEDKK
jgi:hypothetical protein